VGRWGPVVRRRVLRRRVGRRAPRALLEELLLEVVRGQRIRSLVLEGHRGTGPRRAALVAALGHGAVGAVEGGGAEGGGARRGRGGGGARVAGRLPGEGRLQHGRRVPLGGHLGGGRLEEPGHLAEGRRGRVPVADAAVGARVAAGGRVAGARGGAVARRRALGTPPTLVQLRRRERHEPIETGIYLILPLVLRAFLVIFGLCKTRRTR